MSTYQEYRQKLHSFKSTMGIFFYFNEKSTVDSCIFIYKNKIHVLAKIYLGQDA